MMWRKIVNTARSFIKNSPSPSAAQVQAPSSANTVAVRTTTPANDEAKAAAYHQLKEAMKELSGGNTVPIITPAQSSISKWLSKPAGELTDEQKLELARFFYEGQRDVPADPSKAVELWTQVASNGDIEAKYSRAVCLKDGVGVQQDSQAAFEELRALADEHNYPYAHYSVAIMYDQGEGCTVDEAKALHHYRLAAKGGIQPALHNIANAYAYGRGAKQSDHNARLFYEAGVEVGDPASCYVLATWHYKGRGGLQVNKQKSFDLQLQAAQAQHPAAMFNIGAALLVGDGVGEDAAKAAEWFEKAGALGIAEAYLNLSKMYLEGKGVPRDLEKARKILSRIAEANEVAREMLAVIEQSSKEGQTA